jgi:dephospho-CoA kinase
MTKRKFLIAGPPASGKSALAKVFKAFDLDDIGYWTNYEPWSGKWVTSEHLLRFKMYYYDVFVGISDNLEELSKYFDKLIWLTISPEVQQERMRKDKAREDRLDHAYRITPMLDHPLSRMGIHVDVDQPLTDVIKDVRSILDQDTEAVSE